MSLVEEYVFLGGIIRSLAEQERPLEHNPNGTFV